MRLRPNQIVAALLTLLLTGLSLTACGKGAGSWPEDDIPAPQASPKVDRSKLSKELNVFNWTEYLPEDILKEFEKLYGVKVNYDTYSSNEEMHTKLKAGGVGYDVVFPSDYMVQVLTREGLLEKLDHSRIPNMTNLEDRFRDLPFDPKNEYSIPYMWGTTGIAYNTEVVKVDSIKGWADLWRPEFKDKLVLSDDPREVIGMALRLNGHSLNSTDAGALEQAKQKLLELKPNIKAYNSDSPKDLLLGGGVVAGVVWSGEAAKAMEENPKIRYVIPSEGSTIWMDNMTIPKGAPHRYTAEVFINFLLDPTVSARLSRAYPYGNPNKEAHKHLSRDHLANPAITAGFFIILNTLHLR